MALVVTHLGTPFRMLWNALLWLDLAIVMADQITIPYLTMRIPVSTLCLSAWRVIGDRIDPRGCGLIRSGPRLSRWSRTTILTSRGDAIALHPILAPLWMASGHPPCCEGAFRAR